MSHQPTRTSDIASEWPEERERKSSKVPSTSKSSSTIRSVTSTSRTTGSTSRTNYGKNGEPEIDVDVDVDIDIDIDIDIDVDIDVEMSGEDDVGPLETHGADEDKVGEWDAKTCFFCPANYSSFELTMEHMEEVHRLAIPEEEKLVVDIETLLSYCHVVIHGYLECIQCGTQRRTLKPLQAHMRDKGHCGFSIEDEGSDFRVFYDFEIEEQDDADDENLEKKEDEGAEKLEDVEDGQVRLPSGRVVGSKTYRVPRPAKASKEAEVEMLQACPNHSSAQGAPATTTTEGPSSSALPSVALTRADKRSLSASKALTQLRTSDRLQLAHLAPAQQRAVLSTQKKQVAKERRAQQWMEGRVRGNGNKFLQARYRADGPGRANG